MEGYLEFGDVGQLPVTLDSSSYTVNPSKEKLFKLHDKECSFELTDCDFGWNNNDIIEIKYIKNRIKRIKKQTNNLNVNLLIGNKLKQYKKLNKRCENILNKLKEV